MVLGAQVSWRDCHRFVRVRSEALVHLYVGRGRTPFCQTHLDPHMFPGVMGGVGEVRGTGSPFSDKESGCGRSWGGGSSEVALSSLNPGPRVFADPSIAAQGLHGVALETAP